MEADPRAGSIIVRVFSILQEADEMGGPPLDEYIALMEAIAAEAGSRAHTARALRRETGRSATRPRKASATKRVIRRRRRI